MVTNNCINIPTGASGTILQGQGVGSAPAFSTATYPSTASSAGKILRADGTNWAASTATYPNTAGTSGNILTSDGTNWNSQSPAGQGASLVFLQSQTASASASITFTSTYITATYNNYILMISNYVGSAGVDVEMTVSTNNGSTYVNSGYQAGLSYQAYNATSFTNDASTTYFIIQRNSAANTVPCSCFVHLSNVTNGNDMSISGHGSIYNSGAAYAIISGQVTTGSVNNIKIAPFSGTITTGTFTLYGVRES